jgi:hypothetical protein
MSLDTYLRSRPDRCTDCGHHLELQGCICAALAAKAEGQSRATTAHPNEAARVEAAIRKLAASGQPFSANDARSLHGVRGGVVGATFTALRTRGVIKPVGDVTSTDAGTHGHRIFQWIGAAA